MTANTGDDNLDERVRALEARLDDLLRRRDVPAPNMRDLRDSDLTKVKDGESPTYSILTGRFGPGRVGRGTVSQSVLGFDRADIGVSGGNPQILLEDGGVVFGMANVAGAIVWFLPGAGKMTLTSGGNLSVVGGMGSARYESFDFTGPYVESGAAAGAGSVNIVNRNNVANVVAMVTGMTGQTGDLHRWRDSLGNVLARVTAAGRFEGPVAAHIEVKRATDQSIPHNTDTTLLYDTVVEDEGSGFSLGSNKVTVLTAGAGRCLLHGANKWEYNAAGTRMSHWMHTPIATGVADEIFDHHASGYCSPGTTEVTNLIARTKRLAVGDTIHCVVYQDSGAARIIEADAYTFPFLEITRLGA